MTWFTLAVLSAIFWGIEGFLHKLSASKGYNSSKVSIIFNLTVCLLSGLFIILFREQIKNVSYLVIIAFLNSAFFFSSFITRLEALKKLDASIFFSISRPAVLFLILIMSFFILNEHIAFIEGFGVVLMIVTMYLLLSKQGKQRDRTITKTSLLLTGTTTILAALGSLTLAFASKHVGTFSFSFLSYAMSILFSYGVSRFFFKQQESTTKSKKSGIYLFNFFGLVFYITALKTGSFALVGSINNFSILLTILISIIVFRERLTIKQVIGVCIAFISLTLLRL
jgi:bacterial/archaeal transporter family protein